MTTSATRKLQLNGAAGVIEALVDEAVLSAAHPAPRGMAIIAHPHPLYGGTMDNKVVHTLARAFVQSGWRALRFNFRGVGASQGVYDEGRGELDDLLGVVAQAAPAGALALAGFSFGSYVVTHAVRSLWAQRSIEKIVLVGAAASRFDLVPLLPDAQERSLVVHGEHDDTVPLASVMDWARPQQLPVTVMPGGGHFFHGQLPLLRSLVARHLRA